MKVILIVGLQASGKSYKLSHELTNNEIVVDDLYITPGKVRDKIINNPDKIIYLVDPYFCDKEFRDSIVEVIKEYTNEIEYIYFENNLNACIRNMRIREGFSKEQTMRYLSNKYIIPQGVKVEKVYDVIDSKIYLLSMSIGDGYTWSSTVPLVSSNDKDKLESISEDCRSTIDYLFNHKDGLQFKDYNELGDIFYNYTGVRVKDPTDLNSDTGFYISELEVI
jgi:predicted kinase